MLCAVFRFAGNLCVPWWFGQSHAAAGERVAAGGAEPERSQLLPGARLVLEGSQGHEMPLPSHSSGGLGRGAPTHLLS